MWIHYTALVEFRDRRTLTQVKGLRSALYATAGTRSCQAVLNPATTKLQQCIVDSKCYHCHLGPSGSWLREGRTQNFNNQSSNVKSVILLTYRS